MTRAGPDRRTGIAGLILLATLGAYFFAARRRHPPCCDANHYLELANRYLGDGLAVDEALRTYAYPWFLAGILQLGRWLEIESGLPVFLLQLGFYYLAALAVVRVADDSSPRLATGLYLALCANIFVLPYTAVTLTDSLYTSLALALLAWTLKLETLPATLPGRAAAGWALAGLFGLTLAIEIRPAALWLTAPVAMALLRFGRHRRGSVATLLTLLIVGAVPLYPQIALNWLHHRSLSPLPVTDLQSQQIAWGIHHIKYATWLGDPPAANPYPASPLVAPGDGPYDLSWYPRHPLEAAKLLVLKLVGAFDFDYLLPYPYRKPALPWAASLIAFTLLYGGLAGTAIHLSGRRLPLLGARFMPALIVGAWSGLTLLSALELRFTLPLLCYFLIVSGALIEYLLAGRHRRLALALAGGWALALPLLLTLAALVRSQSPLSG